jgi:hypothetical protein
MDPSVARGSASERHSNHRRDPHQGRRPHCRYHTLYVLPHRPCAYFRHRVLVRFGYSHLTGWGSTALRDGVGTGPRIYAQTRDHLCSRALGDIGVSAAAARKEPAMDGKAFDTLVQMAVRESSRRRVLCAGIGTLAASALGLVRWSAAEDVAAKKKHHKKKKKTCPKRCFGVCVKGGGVCCQGPSDGFGGWCDSSYPHCCSASDPTGGGCCESGYPICCFDPSVGGYCCPAGAVCCGAISGCCASSGQPVARGQRT